MVEYVLSQNKERVRPVANFDDKLVVNLGVKFQDIVSFDRYNGDLKLNIWSTLVCHLILNISFSLSSLMTLDKKKIKMIEQFDHNYAFAPLNCLSCIMPFQYY